jgi:iron complex outermembrane receptor protein
MSVDVRLVSSDESSTRWIAGVYWAEIEREVVVAYGADTGNGFLRQPYVPATGPNPTDLLFWDKFDTNVMAVYGQMEFDLSDTWELALAARYDREERTVDNQVPNVNNSGLNVNLVDANFAPLPINPALAGGAIADRSADFNQFQPKVTLSWAASDQINWYASYGMGFRSGGFNSVGTSDTLNFWFNSGFGGPGEAVDAQLQITDDYDKEISRSIELGVKAEYMDRRVRVNAAVFKTDVDDNQFFEFFAGPFGLLRTVTTIDELTIRGFEVDATFAVTENLSIYGGAGFLDSEILENRNRPLSVGNDVPQAPNNSSNLGVQWVSSAWSGVELVARVDYQRVGQTHFHTLQGEQTPTIWNAFFAPGFNADFSKSARDSYSTVDARISLEAADWTVTVWGRNITDEQYLQEVIPAPEFGGTFNHPSARDAYGLDVTYRF